MSDAAFLGAAWLLFCSVSIVVWQVGRAMRRPFDAPLAYAITLTALWLVRVWGQGVGVLPLCASGLVHFGLYYATGRVIRFIWRMGVKVWEGLDAEAESGE